MPRLSAEDAELLKTLKEQRKQEAAPKDPDFLEDPKGYVDANTRRVTEALKKLDDAQTESRTERQQQEQVTALMGAVQAHEVQFAAKTADYNDALAHVRTVRGNQLRLLAPQATDAQIMQQIGREELGAAHQVISSGGNPAEFAYNYAKTMGYVPKAAANGAAGGMQAAAQNTQNSLQQAPADKPDKNAVRTMGGGGGAEPADDDQGDAMPEFTAAVAERFGKKRK